MRKIINIDKNGAAESTLEHYYIYTNRCQGTRSSIRSVEMMSADSKARFDIISTAENEMPCTLVAIRIIIFYKADFRFFLLSFSIPQACFPKVSQFDDN